MGEILNLRMARKRKARAEREAEAAKNRVAHGLNRAEKQLAESRRALQIARLDAHRRSKHGPLDSEK